MATPHNDDRYEVGEADVLGDLLAAGKLDGIPFDDDPPAIAAASTEGDHTVNAQDDPETIVRDLVTGGPRTRENNAGDEECAICGDPLDRHTDSECEWLRARAWVAAHPLAETTP